MFSEMSERYFKVLRSDSLSHLQQLLSDAIKRGWEPVGNHDLFNGEYAQAIKLSDYEDDTTEVITIKDVSINR